MELSILGNWTPIKLIFKRSTQMADGSRKTQTAYHITCNFPENNQSYLPGRRSRHFLLWYFQVPCDQPIPKLALVHFPASDLLFVAPSWIFFFPRRARAFCSAELEIPRAQGSKSHAALSALLFFLSDNLKTGLAWNVTHLPPHYPMGERPGVMRQRTTEISMCRGLSIIEDFSSLKTSSCPRSN